MAEPNRTEYGPFGSESEALATRAAAVLRAASAANPGVGAGDPARLKLLTGACEAAGVVLGDYDLRLLRWLSKYENTTCVRLAGMIHRAYEAGKAAGPDGAVAEWALAYTHRPTLPGVPVRRILQPYPDEADARESVEEIRRLAPEDEPALMQRTVSPWKEEAP